jgi:hypothetical protein
MFEIISMIIMFILLIVCIVLAYRDYKRINKGISFKEFLMGGLNV